jgi:hypothetical protein
MNRWLNYLKASFTNLPPRDRDVLAGDLSRLKEFQDQHN